MKNENRIRIVKKSKINAENGHKETLISLQKVKEEKRTQIKGKSRKRRLFLFTSFLSFFYVSFFIFFPFPRFFY